MSTSLSKRKPSRSISSSGASKESLQYDHLSKATRVSKRYLLCGKLFVALCIVSSIFFVVHQSISAAFIYEKHRHDQHKSVAAITNKHIKDHPTLNDAMSQKRIAEGLKLPNLNKVINDLDAKLPEYAVSNKIYKGLYGQKLPPNHPLASQPAMKGSWKIQSEFSTALEYNTAVSKVSSSNSLLIHKFPHDIDSLHNNTVSTDGRPVFVFHIGPGKTGSTTLQVKLEHFEAFLRLDNYFFMGIFPLPYHTSINHQTPTPGYISTENVLAMHDCFMHDLFYCGETEAIVDFKRHLEYHRKLDHNVIFSFENWSTMTSNEVNTNHKWYLWKEILSDWDVHIVITYRRLHDWLPSLINQYYKTTQLLVKGQSLWPKNGGAKIPTVRELFDDEMEITGDKQLRQYFNPHQNPLKTLEKWKPHFPKIKILDTSNNKSDMEEFVCDILPNTSKSCLPDKIEQLEIVERLPGVKNPSVNLYCDQMVVIAHEKGWVDNRLTRKEVRDAVVCRLKALNKTAAFNHPTECLSDRQMDRLWNMTKAYEEKMLLVFNEQNLRESFDNTVKKGLFCSVDAEKLFNSGVDNWQRFFLSLRPDSSTGQLYSNYTHC